MSQEMIIGAVFLIAAGVYFWKRSKDNGSGGNGTGGGGGIKDDGNQNLK